MIKFLLVFLLLSDQDAVFHGLYCSLFVKLQVQTILLQYSTIYNHFGTTPEIKQD